MMNRTTGHFTDGDTSTQMSHSKSDYTWKQPETPSRGTASDQLLKPTSKFEGASHSQMAFSAPVAVEQAAKVTPTLVFLVVNENARHEEKRNTNFICHISVY